MAFFDLKVSRDASLKLWPKADLLTRSVLRYQRHVPFYDDGSILKKWRLSEIKNKLDKWRFATPQTQRPELVDAAIYQEDETAVPMEMEKAADATCKATAWTKRVPTA